MPRRQLLLVVVVVGVAAGPLDSGSGLTGTLHYSGPLERDASVCDIQCMTCGIDRICSA